MKAKYCCKPAASSDPRISCLIYRQANITSADEHVYLIVAANLSDKPASATITLRPEILGMTGNYRIDRVDCITGKLNYAGVASKVLATSELAPWQIEGLRLTKSGTQRK